MKLDCYRIHDTAPELVPARPERMWMDGTHNRFAYRCTPITMANTTGWELLCPYDIAVSWSGGAARGDISISEDGKPAGEPTLIQSHFGHGIVTFHPGYIFRTDPDWALWCRGAPNMYKDGLTPLEGLVETDWLPFTFTMNWRFTRVGTATFRRGDPFCFLTPVPHIATEAIRPRILPLSADPQLQADHAAWRRSRDDFNARLDAREPGAVREKWQRHYLRGAAPDGPAAPEAHRIKRRMRAPQVIWHNPEPGEAASRPPDNIAVTKQHIIWIASYPKSGNTWVRAFLHALRREMAGQGDKPWSLNQLHEDTAWEVPAGPYEAILEKRITEASALDIARTRPQVQRRLANGHEKPFLVKTHLSVGMDHHYPTINLDATHAAIYVVRNPLDVAVSYAHHTGHPIERIVEHLCTPALKTVLTAKDVNETIGSWSQNVASWLGMYQRPVLFLRYEDLLSNPTKHFGTLVRFLGWPASDVEIESAIAASTFGRLQALEAERGFNEKPATAQVFFREGKQGGWKDVLSHDQIRTLTAAHAPVMQRFGYLSNKMDHVKQSAKTFL